jgi:hypothetical protein
MGAGTVAEPRRATKSKAVTTGGVAANIFRWFVRLGAVGKRILRPTMPHALRVLPRRAPSPLKPKTPAQSQRQPNLSQPRSLLA